MIFNWRGLGAAACLLTASAHAQIVDNTIRIGVLNDITGVFQDTNGMGSVEAARMAAEDFAAFNPTIKVEVVFADHQNKPDVGATIARRWLDVDKVDAIVDVPNSSVGLAVNGILRGSHAAFLASSTATAELTGKSCSPNTIQWVTDTWSLGHVLSTAMIERGADSWYFLTVDYAMGHGIEAEATKNIEAHGGKVLGAARHPLGTSDFASYLLQAQSSGAKVIGLANAGADAVNAVKQAGEFGIGKADGQSLVGFLVFANDVHAMGLQNAQGLMLAEGFYWNLNDSTRSFAKRFAARPGMNGKMPSGNQAGVYSSTLAYLHAAAAANSSDGPTVIAAMKSAPVDDTLFGRVTVRADGRVLHPVYIFQVKAPADSQGEWDLYKLVAEIPADKAFRPLGEGGCPLVKAP